MCHYHPELRRDHVDPLRGLLADQMHGRPAARAAGIGGRDGHVHARQMGRKRAALGSALLAAGPRRRRILLVVGTRRPQWPADILSQLQLLGIGLSGGRTASGAIGQQMLQVIHPRQRVVALGDRSVSLNAHRRYQRLQRFDIHRQLIRPLAHARN